MFPKAHTLISLALCALLPLAASASPVGLAADCPTVEVNRYKENESGSRKYVLGALIVGGDPARVPTFRWCISAGRITRGQETGEIEIDAADVMDEGITVTLIVGNFPWPCNDVAVYKITLPKDSEPQPAPPNNGMHPTADTQAFKYLQSPGAAGDAGR